MNKKVIVLTSFLYGLSVFVFGQSELRSGIIYGDNHVFGLTAPEGWILDNKSGVNQGLDAVLYRKGESWEKAITVMYANTASLENNEYKTIDDLINYGLNNFKKNYPDIKVIDSDDVNTRNNVNAKIKYLSGKSYGNHEAIAYIDAGKTVVMIIMSSSTKEGFDNSLIAFKELVRSYIFISDQMMIKKNK